MVHAYPRQGSNRLWRLPVQTRSALTGLAFISPWIVGFLMFTLYPVLASFYYSLTRYDVIRPEVFVGLENYQQLLLRDDNFRIALSNTLYLVVFGVPTSMVTAFLLANLLNTKMRARPLFRTVFFIPSIVPVVSSVMVWLWIYNTQYGLIGGLLSSLGLQAIPFLSDPALAKPSLIIVNCWAVGGSFLIFLAALQDVPRGMYEAAMIDGAGRFRRFWHITVPMCTPSVLFVMATSMISTFQEFVFPYLLTNGGPNKATELYAIYLYRNAFEFFKMGYASALAALLFVITVISSMLLFRSSGRWVHYAV